MRIFRKSGIRITSLQYTRRCIGWNDILGNRMNATVHKRRLKYRRKNNGL